MVSAFAGVVWDDFVAQMVERRARRARVPVRHPGLRRRDADAERRGVRPGGRRHDRVRARVRSRARRDRAARGRRRAASRIARACSRAATAGSSSRSGSSCRAAAIACRSATASSRRRSASPRAARAPLRRGPRHRDRAAPRQGHGRRPGGSRVAQRRLVLHQPDRRRHRARAVESRAGARPPSGRSPTAGSKLAAAWLIERAGFAKGTTRGRVGISHKHALALVNRGGATARELLALAGEISGGVRDRLGVDARARAGDRRRRMGARSGALR